LNKILYYISKTPFVWLAASLLAYLLSFLFINEFTSQNSLKKEVEKIQQYINKNSYDFNNLSSDSLLIQKLSLHKESKLDFDQILQKPFGFYLIKKYTTGNNEMVFWNNQLAVPDENLYNQADGWYFNKLENGYYLSIKKSVSVNKNTDTIIAFGLVPVLYEYFAETDYLPNEFAHSKNAGSKIELSEKISDYPVKNNKGETIFYIKTKDRSAVAAHPSIVLVLRLLGIFFLLMFLHFTSERIAANKGILQSIGFLIAGLFLMRMISYYTSFPLNLRQFELFDPSIYGANALQKSLGDLMINAAFFCWVMLYAWNKFITSEKDWMIYDRFKMSRFWDFLIIISIVLSTFIIATTIRSMAADSNISFDVIDFFSLTRFSVFGFGILSILVIGYYFLIRILLRSISTEFNKNKYFIYLTAAIAGLAYLTINIKSPLLEFYLYVLCWLIAYLWLQHVEILSINKTKHSISGALFWIFFFSIFITVIIINANTEKEWEHRKRMAENMDVQSDPYSERQLSISFTYIDDEFLSDNFNRFYSENTNQFLRDSILRKVGFLNKYDSRLYLYDENGKSLFNEDNKSVNTINTIIDLQAKPTNTPHLYFYETSSKKITFIFKREVKDSGGNFLGSLFILSNPEQYSSDALYAELFRQKNRNNPEQSPVYSYAIYKNGILTTDPSNKYSFATSLTSSAYPLNQFESRISAKYNELWYRASNDKVIVIVQKKDSLLESITLFSYIFCSFLVLVVFLNMGAILIKFGGNYKIISRLLQWNIRSQIHSTIIFISIISFVIIGIATISFFIKRYEQNNTEKLSRTMQITLNEMEKKLDKHRAFDDQLAIYDSVSNLEVQSLVNEVAEVHNVDVNVYDTSGNLQLTSQSLIYREGFLSKKIHPQAFYHINRLRQVQYVQQEKLATLDYLSIYAPIRDAGGHTYAYLNIPYFLSQQELKQEISFFLVTIINLNAFIFLIAGIIALFITNRVTRSFLLISEKMKEVNLGKTNETITWKRDDEIGELITEYNKMVNKLEASADALAKSEREGAWREMARQVAHEIKNPLTPMKLSIQYLQKSIENNSGNIKELTTNVANTLIEQINHLSKIAFDFSQFANIGNTNPEKFDLKDVLNSLRDLYQLNENVELIVKDFPGEIILYTDKTQMNRLFTNLFQNAMEACSSREKCLIEIQTTKNEKTVIVAVKDNGEGIPVEKQEKIFTPNFTTKSSGTGLGLAMCKGITEKADGKIWFETINGKGTTFFVELPLAD